MTPSGNFTSLHQFNNSDGSSPRSNLIQATDGRFYGTAYSGGTGGQGTVFRISTSGKFNVLYNFDSTHGSEPTGALVQASNGNLYGTASAGGAGGGVIFKMTLAGALTVIHSFGGGSDGSYPGTALVQAPDGNLYGHPFQPSYTIFRINPKAPYAYKILGDYEAAYGVPTCPLFQHTNGVFYGDTVLGGMYGEGLFYSFDMGLEPFVSLVSTSGKVGKTIGILGQGFKGATGVFFNGTTASFEVSSKTYLKATVPAGATTGPVTVVMAGGTLTSDKVFRVTPKILSFSPASGPVGTPVTITGTSFTGTTKVTFGGVKATIFSVDSDTQVTATVPIGAKTGRIAITTPGGTATSPTDFTVTP